MTHPPVLARLREIAAVPLPVPGSGQTALRHRMLMKFGQEDLSLARLAEAHFDAVAILAEAGRQPAGNALYGVWASEKPGQALQLQSQGSQLAVSGSKPFCSGAGLVDRALVTVGAPEPSLADLDLRGHAERIQFDYSSWKTDAFADTWTASALFKEVPMSEECLVGPPGWYLQRPGFWHGACGPAACWAGGAARILDYAMTQARSDPHTLAHLGGIDAAVWGLGAYLDAAGHGIDAEPDDAFKARVRARTVRHLVEQAASETLQRLARAYGPYPFAFDEGMSRHCQELQLYLRQCHAERDLEALGSDLIRTWATK